MLTIVGSIASVSNGLSRGVFAALVDRFGFKVVYIGIQFSNLAVTAAIGYIGKDQYAYLFLLAILMGCYGAMLSIFPTVSSKLFGTKVIHNIHNYFYRSDPLYMVYSSSALECQI
jgi:MFS family permease